MAIRCFIVLLLVGGSFVAGGVANDSPIVFESDIQPLLAIKCGMCHSDDVQKGGLDLSSMRGVHDGGETGEDLVAESIDDSYLWTVIDTGEMPPEGHPPLEEKELDVIRQWIIGGGMSDDTTASEKQITQHDVLPIILLRCTTCHGPRLKEGDLDLRTPSGMFICGRSGVRTLVYGRELIQYERLQKSSDVTADHPVQVIEGARVTLFGN